MRDKIDWSRIVEYAKLVTWICLWDIPRTDSTHRNKCCL